MNVRRLSWMSRGGACVLTLLATLFLAGCGSDPGTPSSAATLRPQVTPQSPAFTSLPAPEEGGDTSLEAAIAERRSVRAFADRSLTLEQLSQLLWAAQGITDPRGFRAAPSAGALYPLEVYVATADGFYHYQPERHRLALLLDQDVRPTVWAQGLKQDALREAPAVFLIAAVYGRTAAKYGQRATRYVHLEAGHAAQNLLLQAVALGLAGVPIGAFHDEELQAALALPEDHAPVYLLAVGHAAD